MPARHREITVGCGIRRTGIRNNMETIWLQRSSPNIPWGFRMIGGREFGLPLTVQRVTPGGVAAAGLSPGDVIFKVGNVMATNLEHSDAQDLVKQAGNILELTIKKPDGPPLIEPYRPDYEEQLSVEVTDYNAVPKGFGTGIPLSNSSGSPRPTNAATPRNFDSPQQPLLATRIEIQKLNSDLGNTEYHGGYIDADIPGNHFPDYTRAYKNQGLVHDSPGGPDNIKGYVFPDDNRVYSTKSLPRSLENLKRNEFDVTGGPAAFEPRSQSNSVSSVSSIGSVETTFNTGLPIQSSPFMPQQPAGSPAQSYQPNDNSTQPSYASSPRPFSPTTFPRPLSPENRAHELPIHIRKQSVPSENPYSESHFGDENRYSDQSNIHGSGSNKYSTLPHLKPSYYSNNNNIYKSTPQPYSIPKPYAPASAATSSTFSQPPQPFTPSEPKQFQNPSSSGSSSGYPSQQHVIRKVSFDKNSDEKGSYIVPTNFTARPYKPVQPTFYKSAISSNSANQHDIGQDSRVTSNGVPIQQPANLPQQFSNSEELYTAVPYIPPAGPLSPRSDSSNNCSQNRYESSSLDKGVNSLNLSSKCEPPSPLASVPPPPPLAPSNFLPPAPPLMQMNSAIYRGQNYQQNNELEEQKIPDQLLGAVLRSANGASPKPFTYGIDLSELKKKMGPPTAPKPKTSQSNYQSQSEEPEATRQYSGPSKVSAGHVQSDYFVKRDDSGNSTNKVPKKSAGHIQTDYLPSRSTGPRSEIDESPINVNMGTDPKKQSKSFKVLQWMTETENEDLQEPSLKPRRTKDPERRYNAEDDEMRFSGINSKVETHSKTYGMLQRISSNDDSASSQNGKLTLNGGDTAEATGSFEDTSMRYKGRNIPSPSFRLLQTWAESDPDPPPPPPLDNQFDAKMEEHNDDLPSPMYCEDKRYMGGNIPSKVFKVLQQSLGDDISDTGLHSYGQPSDILQQLPLPPEDDGSVSEF